MLCTAWIHGESIMSVSDHESYFESWNHNWNHNLILALLIFLQFKQNCVRISVKTENQQDWAVFYKCKRFFSWPEEYLDDCLITAWWLPDNCQMIAWWLPDDHDCLIDEYLLDSLNFRQLESWKTITAPNDIFFQSLLKTQNTSRDLQWTQPSLDQNGRI
jgi:hypothetical protein